MQEPPVVAGAWLGRNEFVPEEDPAVKPHFKAEHKDAFISKTRVFLALTDTAKPK